MVMSDRDFDRIKISVSLSNFIYDYTNLILKDESERKFVNRSLEKRDGLKILLKDMYDNSDSSFIELYKDMFSSTFGFHRRKTMSDRHIDIFNRVFLFLEAYRYNKDSFDNFSSICEEIFNNNYSKDFIFNSNRLDLIKRVISLKDYKDVPELSRFFKYLLTSSDEELSKSNLYYQNMMLMVESALSSDEDFSCDISNSIIKYAMDNYKENDIVVDILYSEHLLYGDRFSYLNNKLKEIETNPFIRREIFSKIIKLNNDMFFELGYEEDYFKKCLDVVFESDTYYELSSRLDLLELSSNLYNSGKKKESFEMLQFLGSEYHKETINGIVMESSYKPKTIIERMANLYSNVDSSKSRELIFDIHDNASSISGIHVGIGSFRVEEKVTISDNKVKKFGIKTLVDKFISKKDIS